MQHFTLQCLDVTFLGLFLPFHFMEFLSKRLNCLKEIMENILIIGAAYERNRPNNDRYTNNATHGSVSWAAFGEQLGQANEQQRWKVVMAVGDVRFAKEEWEDPDLTHASAPSLQKNLEKKQHRLFSTLELYARNPAHFILISYYMLFLLLVNCRHLPTFSSLRKFSWRRYCLL